MNNWFVNNYGIILPNLLELVSFYSKCILQVWGSKLYNNVCGISIGSRMALVRRNIFPGALTIVPEKLEGFVVKAFKFVRRPSLDSRARRLGRKSAIFCGYF